MSWKDDYNAAQPFVLAAKNILGPMLLVEGTLHQDQCEVGDLVLRTRSDFSIGVRIRAASTSRRYWDQFTIRYDRYATGAKTEFAKIVEGFGDWFFYGIRSERPPSFQRWTVIDLNQFRAFLIRKPIRDLVAAGVCGETRNHDRETSFMWFDIRKMPKNIVLNCSWPDELNAPT